jgi:hypothetical protein
MVTDVVGAIRTRDGKTIGYIGASILIERIGRRLSSISFADKAHCQIVDQTGFRLFTHDFKAETEPTTRAEAKLISDIRKEQRGYLSQGGNIYSFDPLESAQWLAIIHQPEEIALCSGSRSVAQNYRAGRLAYRRYPGRCHPGREILPTSGRSNASD